MWTWSKNGLFWVKAQLKMHYGKTFCVQRNPNLKLFGKHRHCILQSKEERGHLACYLHSVQISDDMRVHQGLWDCQCAHLERHCEWRKVYTGFRAQLNQILHLFQQHSFRVETSRCWTGLSSVHIFLPIISEEWNNFLYQKSSTGHLYPSMDCC